MKSRTSINRPEALVAAIAAASFACGSVESESPQTPPLAPHEKVLAASDLYRKELKTRCLSVIDGGDRFMKWDGIWGETDLQVKKNLADGSTEFCECDRNLQSERFEDRPDRGVCEYTTLENGGKLKLRIGIGVNHHSEFPEEFGATACVTKFEPQPRVEGERCPTDNPCVSIDVLTPEDEEKMRQGERTSDYGDSLSYVTNEPTQLCGIIRGAGACSIFPLETITTDVPTDIAACRSDFEKILADVDEIIAAGQNLPIELCDEHFRDRCQNHE